VASGLYVDVSTDGCWSRALLLCALVVLLICFKDDVLVPVELVHAGVDPS
jgi:hypothetical protein